jgi:hypothetical protein
VSAGARFSEERARHLSVTTPAGRGGVSIDVKPRTYGPQSEADLRNTFACDHAGTGANKTTCIYRTEPDGAVVTGVLLAGKSGGRQYQVDVFRADDTVVRLVVSNTYYEGTPDPNATHKLGGSEPPLTLDQIIAVGRDTGLTLYP